MARHGGPLMHHLFTESQHSVPELCDTHTWPQAAGPKRRRAQRQEPLFCCIASGCQQPLQLQAPIRAQGSSVGRVPQGQCWPQDTLQAAVTKPARGVTAELWEQPAVHICHRNSLKLLCSERATANKQLTAHTGSSRT